MILIQVSRAEVGRPAIRVVVLGAPRVGDLRTWSYTVVKVWRATPKRWFSKGAMINPSTWELRHLFSREKLH